MRFREVEAHPHATVAVRLLAAYLRGAVPLPRTTEYSFWSFSCRGEWYICRVERKDVWPPLAGQRKDGVGGDSKETRPRGRGEGSSTNMKKIRRSVAQLSVEALMDIDEVLIRIWDAGMGDVMGPGYVLSGRELSAARRALGLRTHRELASPGSWIGALGITKDELQALLVDLELLDQVGRARLSKKAINRLSTFEAAAATRIGVESSEVESENSTSTDFERFEWEPVGKSADQRFLDVAHVVAIHEELARDFVGSFDPISPVGVKSVPLLQSAVSRPSTSLGEESKYPTIEMAAAALLVGLVHNHAFHNGNKRTALVSMLAHLDENGLMLTCTDDELFKLVLQLAQHSLVDGPSSERVDRETLCVARWLKDRTRWVERGDRRTSWRRLKQLLSGYGCDVQLIGTAPNKYQISRTISVKGGYFSRRPRTQQLQCKIQVIDDGRDLDRNVLRKVRSELHLDEEHGVDSLAFYGKGSRLPSDFIVQYRKLLGRLSRV